MNARILWLILVGLLILPTGSLSAQETSAFWDGQSRFTVLLMGVDRRPTEGDEWAFRSDSMMIVSYDPTTQQIGMLSIPRDIHFALPDGSEFQRINTLLVEAELSEPGSGPDAIINTLQYNLGMYIDGFVLVDFQAFITFVDAIGGIVLDVPYLIRDDAFPDMNYGYDPLYLEPGLHLLDGETALKYARTRHQDSDWVRVQRQLQVVEAVKEKVSDPIIFQNLMLNAPLLYAELQANVWTNISLEQAGFLALAAIQVDAEAVTTGVVSKDHSMTVAQAGDIVRIPDRELLVELLVSVFGESYAE